MNIFLVGGGGVGFHLARLLSMENHDVTVVEQDRNILEQIDYELDVSSVRGSAVSVIQLKETGVPDADLFISATGDDEINLISAATAKGLGAKQVVARVDAPNYTESSILLEAILGIDYILSPNALTALEIAKFIETPGLVATEEFGRGHVQMRQIKVTSSPASNGKTLSDVTLPGEVLVGMISRQGRSFVPHGASTIEADDLVTFIGRKEALKNIHQLFQGHEPKAEKVVVMGGGSIGLHLTQVIEKRYPVVKLFDRDLARCNALAAQLKSTRVVCRDATTRVALEQEHVAGADAFVATTRDDERNIMAGVLAKEVGAHRTIAVVHQPDFAPLVGRLGIDHAVTPRAGFANRVLKLVHQERASSSALIGDGQVQLLEFVVKENTPILGRPLKEVKLPREALVAAILRDDGVIIPHGDSKVAAGDSVVLLVRSEYLPQAMKFFRP